ncbi:MAG TPA: 3-methyladenine DNA glycosylase [Pseudonocardiaceae bacterium]|nr:3-methyladenine DNA glycosylase [Pseudonocardiaceae bacterium]
MAPTLLPEAEWTARRAAHRARVRAWTEPHRARKARGEAHPVLDFLFTYYSHRASRLERWHPGPGIVLAGPAAREYLDHPGYAETEGGVALNPAAFTPARRRTAEFVLALLTATANRAPRFGCFGLHEWAMLYRASAEQVRHAGWPLRLGGAGTDAVLESLPVRCTHFDAFRFFTPQARPRNALTPTREQQVDLEQPGCLHSGMDTYKWAYKLDPFVPSELVADCFALALRIRELDMRASPYDLSALGYTPVRIETPGGRAEYARLQAAFAADAAPLRSRLITACHTALTLDTTIT